MGHDLDVVEAFNERRELFIRNKAARRPARTKPSTTMLGGDAPSEPGTRKTGAIRLRPSKAARRVPPKRMLGRAAPTSTDRTVPTALPPRQRSSYVRGRPSSRQQRSNVRSPSPMDVDEDDELRDDEPMNTVVQKKNKQKKDKKKKKKAKKRSRPVSTSPVPVPVKRRRKKKTTPTLSYETRFVAFKPRLGCQNVHDLYVQIKNDGDTNAQWIRADEIPHAHVKTQTILAARTNKSTIRCSQGIYVQRTCHSWMRMSGGNHVCPGGPRSSHCKDAEIKSTVKLPPPFGTVQSWRTCYMCNYKDKNVTGMQAHCRECYVIWMTNVEPGDPRLVGGWTANSP